MKVTVDSAAPSERGLRLGLKIQHEKAGWIRFAGTVVLYEQLTLEDMQAIVQWWHQGQEREERDLDTPLPLWPA